MGPSSTSVTRVTRWSRRRTRTSRAVPLDTADVLLLALGELVGNVVRHAGAGRMRVGVALGAGWLRLDVADRGAGLPRLPAPRAGGPGVREWSRAVDRAADDVRTRR
ncbi:ATP-binding protein [Streptomyces virginiae]|uniref:ATP-binding protein n=1 Tax=Streptomyces virginiae TaxID=1961 RepID=UPI0036CD5153